MVSPKRIEHWISLGNLKELHPKSVLYGKNQDEKLELVMKSGFVGIAGINQEINPNLFGKLGLKYASAFAFSNLKDGMNSLKEAADLGVSSITIHLGNGCNSEKEVHDWIEKILKFSTDIKIPVLFETHRGTALQDIFRTVQLLKKYQKMYLVGDFSHWYNGLLLGQDFEKKITWMELVFQRTAILHGRIASDSCIQPAFRRLDITTKRHFKVLWLSVFEKSKTDGPEIPFIIELLSHNIGYDPGFLSGNDLMESTDRWEDALELKQSMQCWYQENIK